MKFIKTVRKNNPHQMNTIKITMNNYGYESSQKKKYRIRSRNYTNKNTPRGTIHQMKDIIRIMKMFDKLHEKQASQYIFNRANIFFRNSLNIKFLLFIFFNRQCFSKLLFWLTEQIINPVIINFYIRTSQKVCFIQILRQIKKEVNVIQLELNWIVHTMIGPKCLWYIYQHLEMHRKLLGHDD